jgi:hypothetical protein
MTIRKLCAPGLFLAAIWFSALMFARPVQSQEQTQEQAQAQQQSAPPSSQQQQPQASSPASAASKSGAQDKGPNKDQSTQQNKDQKAGTGEEPSATSKDRLFFALPNFLTVENAGQIPPLSTKQKFKVVAQGSFDYVEFGWYAALSGISQAENSEPGYGQGAEGYGKRYGAALADGTIENFMTQAIFPSVLRQDPRYYQMGKGGFWHRTEYAISRIFITRTDSKGEQFNASEIFGSALSAGISSYSYHPGADRTVDNSLKVWGTQVGYDTLTLVVKEFWPDIRRAITKKKNVATAPSSTSTP